MKKHSNGSILYFSECFPLLDAYNTSPCELFDEQDILEIGSVKRSIVKVLSERYPEAALCNSPFDRARLV